jgi:hypothetical protein
MGRAEAVFKVADGSDRTPVFQMAWGSGTAPNRLMKIMKEKSSQLTGGLGGLAVSAGASRASGAARSGKKALTAENGLARMVSI